MFVEIYCTPKKIMHVFSYALMDPESGNRKSRFYILPHQLRELVKFILKLELQ